mmetsp:Transcript_19930/g.29646  ORF Transcript_19930/g.29646 Transcript_19930/m.29646 type:complete len:329 (+) Transcript_19930:68-1054(+)
MPIRSKGQNGRMPTPGDGSADWLGFVAWEDMPYAENPEQGFLASANNLPGLPEQLNAQFPGYFAPGFRAQRIIDMIIERIESGQKIDKAYMGQIQNSVLSLEFPYLLETVKKLSFSNPTSKVTERYDMLLSWNGNETVSDRVARTWRRFSDCLGNVTFFEAGRSVHNTYVKKRIFNSALPSGQGDDPSCGFWGMTCLQYASECFVNATNAVGTSTFGFTHKSVFFHLPPTPTTWNRLTTQGGSPYTPFAASIAIPLQQGLLNIDGVIAGPGIRQIVDQADKMTNQLWVLPPGNSGNPQSQYYGNQLEFWRDGDYISVNVENQSSTFET